MAFDIEFCRSAYPFESHWFDLDGLRYHYLDEGHGDPVVMVHGNPTWSFYYRNLVKELRADYRCIAVDHIGCGLSDKPSDAEYEYVLERRIDDLERLLDHLGLTENVTLVLHDWGGMIGMGCALRKPERIGRLVLLNTAAFALPAEKRFPWRLWMIRSLAPVGAVLVRGLNAFAYLATHMACRQGMAAQTRQAYCGPYDSWANRIATLRFVQDIPLSPGDRSYEQVKWIEGNLAKLAHLPALICWGGRDFVFDRHFLAQWRRYFPAAQVHEFPSAGHYVLEDAGAEIIPLVGDFLRRSPLVRRRSEAAV